MKQPHILVLDSGVGGLSVVRAIRGVTPGCHITYLADVAEFPYGGQCSAKLTSRVTHLITHALSVLSVDMVVVACNTASTVVLDVLRSRFGIPFIGVVPAIKPAAVLSHSKAIGVLATEGTVTRTYTLSLIEQFAQQCQVALYGSARLVQLAERKLQGLDVNIACLQQEFDGLRKQDQTGTMDTVVLACTHFPLLKEELSTLFPEITHWVDSGQAIARRVQFWLNELNLSPNIDRPENHQIYITAALPTPYNQQAVENLIGQHQQTIMPL